MKIKLSLSQKQKLAEMAEKNGLVFAVVFGSAAQGRKQPKSDFDIAVLTKKKPSARLFYKLFQEFSNIFKGENVDVRFLNEADPFFRFEVIKDGQLIYGDLQTYNQFKIYTLKIYLDDGKKYFPYLEKLLEKNQQKLEKTTHG